MLVAEAFLKAWTMLRFQAQYVGWSRVAVLVGCGERVTGVRCRLWSQVEQAELGQMVVSSGSGGAKGAL